MAGVWWNMVGCLHKTREVEEVAWKKHVLFLFSPWNLLGRSSKSMDCFLSLQKVMICLPRGKDPLRSDGQVMVSQLAIDHPESKYGSGVHLYVFAGHIHNPCDVLPCGNPPQHAEDHPTNVKPLSASFVLRSMGSSFP